MSAIGLGAWCEDGGGARDGGGSPEGILSPRHVDDAGDSRQLGLPFDVQEFADLSDGRRLTLHSGRGFTSRPSATSVDPWQLLTIEHLEHLPYDIEFSQRVRDRLRQHRARKSGSPQPPRVGRCGRATRRGPSGGRGSTATIDPHRSAAR